MNKPRVASVATLIGDSIFVFGGVYKSIEVFNINELKWQLFEIKSMPSLEIMSLIKIND